LQNSVCTWSFPKERRFKNSYKDALTESYYQLPEFYKNSRGTTMGYGKKTLPFKNEKIPSPADYKIKSSFEENLKNKKGFSLGCKIFYKVRQN
jgi:hypothetical protein